MSPPLVIVVDSNTTVKLTPEVVDRLIQHVMHMEWRKRYESKHRVSMDYDQYRKEDAKQGTTMMDYFFNSDSSFGNNMAGVLVLCLILVAVGLVFCAGFLLYRLCQRTISDVHRKMTMDFTRAFPDIVAHPKRVYEIQAEEGVYSQSDSPSEEEQPKAGSLRRTRDNSLEETSDNESLASSTHSHTSHTSRGQSNSQYSECPRNDELPTNFRKKERKIHKDSVCAMIFRPQAQPRMV